MAAQPSSARNRVQYFAGFLLLAAFCGHLLHLWQFPFLRSLDAYLYDTHVRLTARSDVDERVVIVDIDEKSLEEIGHWPWGRHQVSTLIRQLIDVGGAAVVGFDVVFAEPDTTSGLATLDALAQGPLKDLPQYRQALSGLRETLDYDRQLADTLRDRPVVLGYYFSNDAGGRKSGALPPAVFPAGTFDEQGNAFYTWSGYGANLPMLQSVARSAGHFNPLVESDGISRRVPLLVEFDGAYYQSLSLAVLRTALGGAGLLPGIPEGGREVEWLDLLSDEGNLRIPVDHEFAALIPYRGGEGSFPYVPAVDVIKGRISPGSLQGRVVLIGTSAPGLVDLRASPVGSTYPGVEMHANLIAGMLDGTILEQPELLSTFSLAVLIVIGAILVFWMPRLSPARAAFLTLLAILLLLGIHVGAWRMGLLLPVATHLILVLMVFAFDMSWGYLVVSRTRRQLAELFGQYIPPELVEEMSSDPESYSMAGRSCELSIMFSDVRSFTTLSEGLDPQELTALMNEYLGTMTEVIRGRRGTLDKYIGDAIMAFWGAPLADAEHARHALLAALEMQAALPALNAEFASRGWPPLKIGIGINSGTVTVGDMGSPVRKAYTVMGDAVNLASRLEGITKEYGVGIVVGEETCQRVSDIRFIELDRVRVKGKEKAVGIFEPIAALSELSDTQRAECLLWEEALGHYRSQAWDEAEQCLHRLGMEGSHAYLYSLYLKRIAWYRDHPPGEQWDGVTTFTTK